ncbi:MAG: hypothetical protein MUO23_02080, partial [Anaerolineales bacterium]|nr:hypothetical protein [Anaerolineales bacterium]
MLVVVVLIGIVALVLAPSRQSSAPGAFATLPPVWTDTPAPTATPTQTPAPTMPPPTPAPLARHAACCTLRHKIGALNVSMEDARVAACPWQAWQPPHGTHREVPMPLRRLPLLVLFVSLGFLLAGCAAVRASIDDAVAPIPNQVAPMCALGKPSPQTPNNSYNPYEVADVRWEYGLPCEPDGYQVDVSTSEDFSGEALGGTTDADSLTWIFDTPQDVAAHYYWRVAAIRDGYVGPFSETRVLRAGPKCVAGDDFGIHLQSPASSADVETLYPTFDWEVYGNGCIAYFGSMIWLYHGPDAPVGLSGPNTGLLLGRSGGSPYTLRDMYDGMRHWS